MIEKSKETLIEFMNCLDFGIADIAYVNGHEMYAHKMIDSNDLAWFPIESGGSGFNDMFRGAIREACGKDVSKLQQRTH